MAFPVSLFHQPVTGYVIAGGLVEQKQVDGIGAQPLQCFVHRVLLLVERRPQFGLQEDLLPVQARGADGPAHRFFIHIGVGGINEAVPGFQSAADRGFRFVRRHQECADADHGHWHVVVQCDVFHKE